jgi:Entner-Doudoroff aldolase
MVASRPAYDLEPIGAAESQSWFDDALSASPLMAILRGHGPTRSLELAQRAWELDVTLVEIPLQTDQDLDSLRIVAAAAAERGRRVGVGTVTNVDQIAAASAAGAVFTVSPGFDPAIVEACHQAGLPALPGVASASEIQRATRLGLRWLKAFPATVLGTGWFQAMHGPFPGIHTIATGGIDAVNAREYLDAGARAVAVGSALADPRQLDQLAELVRDQSTRRQTDND